MCYAIVQAKVCNVCDGVVMIQAVTKENNSETTALAPQTVKHTIEANEVATQGMAFYLPVFFSVFVSLWSSM